MPDKKNDPKLAFSFMARAFDKVLGGDYFEFDIKGEADAHAIIRLQAPGAKAADDCRYVVLVPHELPGQFNVVACSKVGKSVNYSFTHIQDRVELGEHLKSLGVPDHLIAQWNTAQPHAAIPTPNDNTSREASADLSRIMKGAKGQGPKAE